MWNELDSLAYEGMLCETLSFGKGLRAYGARPLGAGPFPGLVLLPYEAGWDEWQRETARRFAQHGYAVVCPNLFGAYAGTPSEAASALQSAGGLRDEAAMEACLAALEYLQGQPYASGKAGVIGMGSGGRHALLAACVLEGFSAAVDCWGGAVTKPEERSPAQPVSPADCVERLRCPFLGVFGNEDRDPAPEEVDRLETALLAHKKDYELRRYDGAGHGFWYYHTPLYRPQQAMDAWERVFAFFGKHLRS